MEEVIKKIRAYFKENKFWVSDISQYKDLPVVAIEIEDGDWKHDHNYCKYLMKKLNFNLIGSEVTHETGEDCYNAIHYFIVNDL